jgi:hypothetical protein
VHRNIINVENEYTTSIWDIVRYYKNNWFFFILRGGSGVREKKKVVRAHVNPYK